MSTTYVQADLYKRMEDRRRAEMRRDADLWRMLCCGQRLRQGRRSTWLLQLGCRLLYQLGRWLIDLGQQLEHYARPERPVMEA
jgi:hypothetical protein